MRLIPILLAILLALIQGPLWFGKGGVLDASEMSRKLQISQTKNKHMHSRNEKLRAEVEDLRLGTSSIEERARYDMGMIKEGEIYIQLTEKHINGINATPIVSTPTLEAAIQ